MPASERKNGIRIELFGDEVDKICEFDILTGSVISSIKNITVFPASHFVTGDEKMAEAIKRIDNAASKGVIKANTRDRYKTRVQKIVNSK